MIFKYIKPFFTHEYTGYDVETYYDIQIKEEDILFRGILYNKMWRHEMPLPYVCVKKDGMYRLFFRTNGMWYEVTKEIYNRYINIPDVMYEQDIFYLMENHEKDSL